MTTPIDEEAEIRRLERETEGLKILIAVSDRAGDDPKPIGPGGGHY